MEQLDSPVIVVLVSTTLLLLMMAAMVIFITFYYSRRLKEQVKVRSMSWMQECDRVTTEIHREFYDNIVQLSHGMRWKLESLQRNEEDSAQKAEVQECIGLMSTLSAECVRIAGLLNSDFLRTKNLHAALIELAEHMSRHHAIKFDVKVEGEMKRLLPEDKLLVLRIAQEAAANIRKHSHATEALLTLKYSPSSFTMIVRDNGLGLSRESSRQAMGQVNMRIRAEMLGGTLYLDSAPGGGCTVTVYVPDIEFALET